MNNGLMDEDAVIAITRWQPKLTRSLNERGRTRFVLFGGRPTSLQSRRTAGHAMKETAMRTQNAYWEY